MPPKRLSYADKMNQMGGPHARRVTSTHPQVVPRRQIGVLAVALA